MTFWRYDPADYDVGSTLYLRDGHYDLGNVRDYIVTRKTPSGQVVAEHAYASGAKDEIRVTPMGMIVGESRYGYKRIIGPEDAAECRRHGARLRAFRHIRTLTDKVDRAAREYSEDALKEAFAELAGAVDEIARDSGGDPKGEDSRSEAECEASQSGGEAASPEQDSANV